MQKKGFSLKKTSCGIQGITNQLVKCLPITVILMNSRSTLAGQKVLAVSCKQEGRNSVLESRLVFKCNEAHLIYA